MSDETWETVVQEEQLELPKLWPTHVYDTLMFHKTEDYLRAGAQQEADRLTIPLKTLRYRELDEVTLSRLASAAVYTVNEFLDSVGRRGLPEKTITQLAVESSIPELHLHRLYRCFYDINRQIRDDRMLEDISKTNPSARSPNSAFVEPNLLMDVDRLVTRKEEIDVRSFSNLCSLTEAVVLQERLIAPVTPIHMQELEGLLDGLMIWNTGAPSTEWDPAPVTDLLREEHVLIDDFEEDSQSALKELSSSVVSEVIVRGPRLGKGVRNVDSLLVTWHHLLKAQKLAMRAGSIEELITIGSVGSLSKPIRRIAVEAARHRWDVCSDVSFFPLHFSMDPWGGRARDLIQRLERFPLAWNRLRPAPPPGHPRDRMLWVAGWGSGPEPNELEML